jgi:hypothetical protein
VVSRTYVALWLGFRTVADDVPSLWSSNAASRSFSGPGVQERGGHPLDLHQGEDARLLVGDQRPEAPRPLITEPNGRAVRYLLDRANLAHASPSSSTPQGEFTMKRLLLAFVTLAVATAFTAPAFAGILDAKNKTECEKAGGVWVEKDNKCGAKKQ